MTEITPYKRRLMRHALGLDRGGLAYRNHYAVYPGSLGAAEWRELATDGLAIRIGTTTNQLSVYQVTSKGRQALDLAAQDTHPAKGPCHGE